MWCAECVRSFTHPASLWEILNLSKTPVRVDSFVLRDFLIRCENWDELANSLARYYDDQIIIFMLRLNLAFQTRLTADVMVNGYGYCIDHAMNKLAQPQL